MHFVQCFRRKFTPILIAFYLAIVAHYLTVEADSRSIQKEQVKSAQSPPRAAQFDKGESMPRSASELDQGDLNKNGGKRRRSSAFSSNEVQSGRSQSGSRRSRTPQTDDGKPTKRSRNAQPDEGGLLKRGANEFDEGREDKSGMKQCSLSSDLGLSNGSRSECRRSKRLRGFQPADEEPMERLEDCQPKSREPTTKDIQPDGRESKRRSRDSQSDDRESNRRPKDSQHDGRESKRRSRDSQSDDRESNRRPKDSQHDGRESKRGSRDSQSDDRESNRRPKESQPDGRELIDCQSDRAQAVQSLGHDAILEAAYRWLQEEGSMEKRDSRLLKNYFRQFKESMKRSNEAVANKDLQLFARIGRMLNAALNKRVPVHGMQVVLVGQKYGRIEGIEHKIERICAYIEDLAEKLAQPDKRALADWNKFCGRTNDLKREFDKSQQERDALRAETKEKRKIAQENQGNWRTERFVNWRDAMKSGRRAPVGPL